MIGTANLSYAVPGLLLCTGACSLHKKPFITSLQCQKTFQALAFQALAFQALARKTFHAPAAFHVIIS